MRVALPWHSFEDHQELADEYNITFVNKPNNFDNLMEFISTHQEERFNIFINTSEYSFDYSKLKILNAIHKKLYFIISPVKEDIIKMFKENEIHFYFSPEYAARNFRSLEQLAKIGVSAVYIAEDLCYNLKKVRKACDKYNIELRWVLDLIPSTLPDKEKDVRSPIILPECMDEFSKYIDVCEFSEIQSWARLETLYKIWFVKRQWRENLRAIYPELEIDIWNQCMIPDFNIYKMNCGYKCGYGSVCKKCNQFKEMADDLYSKNIEYIIEKEG